jgi:hypothetical protein
MYFASSRAVIGTAAACPPACVCRERDHHPREQHDRQLRLRLEELPDVVLDPVAGQVLATDERQLCGWNPLSTVWPAIDAGGCAGTDTMAPETSGARTGPAWSTPNTCAAQPNVLAKVTSTVAGSCLKRGFEDPASCSASELRDLRL